jgi:phage baseplate assembly protein V
MLRFGKISDIDPDKCYARVRFTDDEIVSDWLQIVVLGAISNQFFHIFDINEQVACLMDENSEDGVIIGAVFNDKTTPSNGGKDIVRVSFSDESFIEYNRSSHEYTIDIKGKINISAESEINITSESEVKINALNATITATTLAKIEAPAIQLNGAVAVSGGLTVGGTITAPEGGPISGNIEVTGDVKAGTVSLKTHIHPGVQTGSGSTGTPTP